MLARVVRWEGGDAAAIKASAAEIASQSEQGPPENLPARGFLLLTDPDGGRALAVTLFESEDDLRQGAATLEAMSPPGDGLGQRTAVEVYDVNVDVRL
jgi:hypothetical protein